jgi:glycosyltransferase involved in cell wall biosynthesis
VTIHDLSVLEHPEWYDARMRLVYRLLLPRLAQRVDTIITVSEHSRRSIIRRLGLPETKVTAIPNAVNLRHFRPGDPTPVRSKYGLPERYMLFVGALEPRKNLDRLLLGWSRLTEFQDVQLVIVGPQVGASLPASMTRLRRRVRYLGYVPDDDLPGLYAGAVFFILPSLFEGFGLTVLEAMACGTPVICSQAGALPEVVGDAAMFVDPTSVEGMTEAMRLLLLEDGRRSYYRQKGLERACKFSWERSAQGIKNLLFR